MANRRMISADIFEDEFTGQLNYFERLLWIGLFTSIADDQGRMIDSTALIRARVFLYDKVTDARVEKALIKLGDAGKIIRYEKDNKNLIQIVKWWVYQTPSWASASKHPKPDNWTDRTKYHTKGNKIISLDWDKDGGLHSRLHSVEPARVDSAINEVNDDVKGEVNVNDDVVVTNNNAPQDLITAFTDYTKLKPGRNAEKIATDLVSAGVICEDIIKAVDFLNNSDKYKCVRFASVKGTSITEMNKRKGKNKIPDKEDPNRYIKGDYGHIGKH